MSYFPSLPQLPTKPGWVPGPGVDPSDPNDPYRLINYTPSKWEQYLPQGPNRIPGFVFPSRIGGR